MEDWIQEIPGPEIKIGYTQSNAKLSGLTIAAQGSYGFDHATGGPYEIYVGFRYRALSEYV